MGLQFRSWLYVLTFVLLVPSAMATAGTSTITIVTSNHPLALIAQQLLGSHGSAVSLLKPGQTPHDFALSFSDRRRVAEADLIIWIGADIEPYLQKLVDSSPGKDLRLDRYWPVKQVDQRHHHSRDHHHHETDFHFWMSPEHAITIARKLHQTLVQQTPEQAAQWSHNLAALEQEITNTDHQLRHTLQYADSHYGIAHNAYSHFIEHYDLPEPLLLSHSTESNPGIKQLLRIQQQLPQGSCVLVEPEHAQGWPKQLSQREGYRLTLVDSLASMDDYSSYSAWLTRVASQFRQCLSSDSQR